MQAEGGGKEGTTGGVQETEEPFPIGSEEPERRRHGRGNSEEVRGLQLTPIIPRRSLRLEPG
jgi:hypothetical protein